MEIKDLQERMLKLSTKIAAIERDNSSLNLQMEQLKRMLKEDRRHIAQLIEAARKQSDET
ncbi:hypothetical protein [Ketogulonicigenium vulgare]|uniref:Uncharacterized protein n=1 Tax=Ketogulonicigenium vulgare (strain WSH-001) TaxID=759362 RepID=F9Y4K7_KETVW|nr:hypothetical protein [Ketogulonicigenium vulgare]AEM40564.1 hypothetical protein KVU_0724 [Ketogulonicigenium vulgare WSH-001]ALJ80745.1 hypothetical protein KVH_05855 [Ketogulonicigenium vulgare]ANW34973.1 hypothetical protein KvSKV_05825 [Ketogulonicigenium vulgare]